MSELVEILLGEGCRGLVLNERAASSLEEKWFGAREERGLSLSVTEVAYLLMSKRARAFYREKSYDSLEQLMADWGHCFSELFWPELAVYKDLRDRGRRVRPISQGVFLVKDKSGALRLVYVLEERRPLRSRELLEMVERGRSNNMPVVLAIVSLQGDLTYYELNKIDPLNR